MVNEASDAPKYVSLAQASQRCNLSARTLRRAIADGRLRAHRIGRLIRIHVADLDQFVQGDVVSAAAPAAGCR
jgi:excisionase family DNA binding protein